MRCDHDSTEDCIVVLLAPALGLRCTDARKQWSSGECPVCHGPKSLSLTLDGKRIAWHCHRTPKKPGDLPVCDPLIRDALVARFPSCISPARRLRAAAASRYADLEPLLYMEDRALRLRLACEVWQMTPKEAAAKLGMSRATYYRAVSDVRQKPKSA